MEMDKRRFRKMFPNIAKELETKEYRVSINSVRSDTETAEKASANKFVGYMPDVIDFIRRCDTNQQAEEIVDYLAKRGEISQEYATRLKQQLRKKGVRSFGTKKEEGYYLKNL